VLAQQHTAELLEAGRRVFGNRCEDGVALETLKAKAPLLMGTALDRGGLTWGRACPPNASREPAARSRLGVDE
jgi:hypothetical protein